MSTDPRIEAVLRAGHPDNFPYELLREKEQLAATLLAAADLVDPVRAEVVELQAERAEWKAEAASYLASTRAQVAELQTLLEFAQRDAGFADVLRDQVRELTAQKQAVLDLHQPIYYSKWQRRTDDPGDAVTARCAECHRSVPLDSGCETFEAAGGRSVLSLKT